MRHQNVRVRIPSLLKIQIWFYLLYSICGNSEHLESVKNVSAKNTLRSNVLAQTEVNDILTDFSLQLNLIKFSELYEIDRNF